MPTVHVHVPGEPRRLSMIDPRTCRLPAARLVVALIVASVLAGCTASPGATGPPTPAMATTTPPPTTPPSEAAVSSPSPSSSPSLSPSAAPSDEEPSLEPPPGATLVAGGVRQAGEAGSWAWAGGTSDAPWLPVTALERVDVPAGAATVELEGGVDVESWTVGAASADDTEGIEVEPLGDGSGTPSFRLPSGDWVVAVDVRFADGRGSAVYYWHLVGT
jgi:hypothetical protein